MAASAMRCRKHDLIRYVKELIMVYNDCGTHMYFVKLNMYIQLTTPSTHYYSVLEIGCFCLFLLFYE